MGPNATDDPRTTLPAHFAPTSEQLAKGVLLVEVHGELDATNALDVRERLLNRVWDGCRAIIVDLTACGFLDSRGLGCLIEASKRIAEESGAFALVSPKSSMGPSRILRIAGVAEHIAVLESRAEAEALVGEARVVRLSTA